MSWIKYITPILLLALSAELQADVSRSSCVTEILPPGLTQLAQTLPNPCIGVPPPTADELAKELDSLFVANTRKTRRPLSFWHYGYRTPRYPEGAPKDVYDNSTPVLSDQALIHPTGTEKDYAGPADPDRNAKEYFLRKAASQLGAKKQKTSWGNGLYATADPLTSLGFYKGALLKITVPAGTGYLDLRSYDKKKLPVSFELHRKIICELSRETEGSLEEWSADRIIRVTEWIGDASDPSRSSLDVKEIVESSTGRKALGKLYKKYGVHFWVMQFGDYSYSECQKFSKYNRNTQMMFINPDLEKRVEAKLLVAELEKSPSEEKRKLYSDAISYFEAFDEKECQNKEFASLHFLCKENNPSGSRRSFWKLYRGWATSLYGLDPTISQLELENVRRKKFEEMSPEKRKAIVESTFGCVQGDLDN